MSRRCLQIVQNVLDQKEHLEAILERVIHSVVTDQEHGRLTGIPTDVNGWERYRFARVEWLTIWASV